MFVQCHGTRFELDGEPFFAEGVNSYFAGFCSHSTRESTLQAARSLGANTLRAWAFLDVEPRSEEAPAFQYFSNGRIQIDEGPAGLERLDHLIGVAEEFGIRLLLPFINFWPDFGGMPLYSRWLGLPRDPADFYRSPKARQIYKEWVEHLLTRRNYVTGRFYCDEPAVLSWELANEPRCEGEGGRDLLLEWIEEMGRFIKSLDRNHLLAVGDEGFFYRSGRSHLYDGTYGVDFKAILNLGCIDFGTYHLYPARWGKDNRRFPRKWIRDHVEAGNRAGKPVLLEEFGIPDGRTSGIADESRNQLYAEWAGHVREQGGAGALVWMLGSDGPDAAFFRDSYTFLPSKPRLLLG